MTSGKANIAISEDLGRAFLRFIYTGELNENLLKEHAPALLELGEKYQMEELKEVAEKEMLEQLDRQNMVRFLSVDDILPDVFVFVFVFVCAGLQH